MAEARRQATLSIEEINRQEAEKITEARQKSEAERKVIAEEVAAARQRALDGRSRTAKGEMMLFLTLEDLQGTLDVILFPDVYRVAKSMFESNIPLLITDMMEKDAEREEPFLRAEKILPIQ